MSNNLTTIQSETESSRAVAEVQAQIEVARKMPRDEKRARERMLEAASDPENAEEYIYAYKRGTTLVSDLSIRAVETMARYWGNLSYGVRELSRASESSFVQAYARDLESNVQITREFTVNHIREKSSGDQKITGQRDIYELVQNMGARRVRACIEELLPGELKKAVKARVRATLENAQGDPTEAREKLVDAFKALGVTEQKLEDRLGHPLENIRPEELVTLRSVYRSIAEGFAKVEQIFPTDPGAEASAALDRQKTPDNQEKNTNA